MSDGIDSSTPVHKVSNLRSRQGMGVTIVRDLVEAVLVEGAPLTWMVRNLKITASLMPAPDEIEVVLINKNALGTERNVIAMNLSRSSDPGQESVFVGEIVGEMSGVEGFHPSISFIAKYAGSDPVWQVDPINHTTSFNFAWTW